MNFHLFFEKTGTASYSCIYYDAFLRKGIEIPDVIISEVNVKELDKRMAETNWATAFTFQEKKELKIDDKTGWLEEENVEKIVTDLQTLEAVEEGNGIAYLLKMKYWCDTPVQDMIGNLSSLKSKLEISQRFYFFDGQGCISVEEAYRFLNNRWLEKQLQAKKKQIDKATIDEHTVDEGKAGSDKSLLQKKGQVKRNKAKVQ